MSWGVDLLNPIQSEGIDNLFPDDPAPQPVQPLRSPEVESMRPQAEQMFASPDEVNSWLDQQQAKIDQQEAQRPSLSPNAPYITKLGRQAGGFRSAENPADVESGGVDPLTFALNQYNKVNVDIPYVTPALNKYVKPAVGEVANDVIPGAQLVKGLTGFDPGKATADVAVPTKSADIALTLAPFVGKVGEGVEGARAALAGDSAAARNIRRLAAEEAGGLDLYHGVRGDQDVIDAIQREGLTKGGLTTDPEFARQFAVNNGIENPTVFKFSDVDPADLKGEGPFYEPNKPLTPSGIEPGNPWTPEQIDQIKQEMRQGIEDLRAGKAAAAPTDEPMSDLEKQMLATMQSASENGKAAALAQGRIKAQEFVDAARQDQAAQGAQYAEATNLSKRVAAITGESPDVVRRNAVRQTYDALKQQVRDFHANQRGGVQLPDWMDLQGAAQRERDAAINEFGTIGQNERDLQAAARARAYGLPPQPDTSVPFPTPLTAPEGPNWPDLMRAAQEERQAAITEFGTQRQNEIGRQADASARAYRLPPAPEMRVPFPTAAEADRGGWPGLVDAAQQERNAAINEFGTVGQNERDLQSAAAGRSYGAPPPPPAPPSATPEFGGLTPEPAQKPRFLSEVMGALGLPQTIMASADVGQTMRQAQILGWSHPQQWKEAAIAGIKAFGSEDAALAARAAVEGSPTYDFAKKAGLKFYDWGDGIEASERVPGRGGINDSRLGKFVNNLGPVKASERSFATTLNVQGMSAFEQSAQSMWDAGVRDERQYKALAKVINHARGYSEYNPGQIVPGFNTFFSGRNMVSRAQILLDPILQPGSLFEASARQLAAKNLAAFMAGNAGMMGFLGVTGSLAGGAWSVDADPRSSNFGKLRIGNTYYDTTAGMGPLQRLLTRVGAEASDSAFGTNLSRPNENWRKEIVQFFRNKEAPIPALLTDELSGKDSQGKKVTFGPDRLAQMFTPFITQDLYDAWQQNQGLNKFQIPATAAASALGVGTQSYRTQTDYRDDEAKKLGYNDYASVNDYGVRKQIDQAVKDAGHSYPESKVQIAGEAARAEAQKAQSNFETAFKQGTLDEGVNDREKRLQGQRFGQRDVLNAFYDQEGIEPSSSFAKKFGSLMGEPADRDKGTTGSGYLGLADKYTDDTGQVDRGALSKAQKQYVQGLSDADKKLFQSYLDYQESQKSDFERRRDKMYADKEAAGYYADGPANEAPKDRAKRLAALGKTLDAKNPDLDVESWYFGGGTKDTSTVPSLNSDAAVHKALAMIQSEGLQNRPVKLAGMPVAINQSAGTQKAFEVAKKPLEFYLDAGGQRNWDTYSREMFGVPFDRLKGKDPDAVKNAIRRDLRANDDQLDNFLRYFGVLKVNNQDDADELAPLLKRYPQK